MENNSDLLYALQLRTASYLQMSTAVIVVYDWIVLFDREVEHIWRKEWNIPKILYLVSRYGPFIEMPFIVATYISPYGALSDETCVTFDKIGVWSTFFGIAISESILLLRTNAVYLGSRWILVPLLAGYVVAFVAGIVIIQLYLSAERFGPPPNDIITGCYLVEGRPIIFYDYVMLLLFELAIVVLTVWKGYENYRLGTPLLRVMYRDSVAFFLILFASSLSSILTMLLAPSPRNRFLSLSIRVAHSIVCSRIILNLRQAASLGDAPPTLPLIFAASPWQQTNQANMMFLETDDTRDENEHFRRQNDDDFVGG